ncbi:MAG: S8 family serine peptidase [Planctomycetia bacterium]|nr:S8 family serine peptidase [Planctomycetia bacterium]
MASTPKSSRWRFVAIPSALLSLVLLGQQSVFDSILPLASDVPAVTVAADEEATPDCGPVVAEDDPVRQRAERLASLGVERWHAAGLKGAGVKIAVLDTGFRGYQEHLGKALPAKVKTRCFRNDGNLEARDSQHGVLCGEVLHALAPAAEIMFATWEPSSPDQFLQAVQWARSEGAQVISCSVIMPSWSDCEGGGAIHARLAKLLGDGEKSGDLLCFASAGNTARRHWCGEFKDDGKGWHEWEPDRSENRLRPWGVGERVSVELCCPAGCRYQVLVRDTTDKVDVGQATSSGSAERNCAIVRFNPELSHRYRVKVKLVQGPAKPFHLTTLGGELDVATHNGSIPFPGDGAAVLAVGAVDEEGRRQNYSSCGPNSPRPKPDFVAPVPFTTLWRDRPFTGTSAAAPQAAGLAALCWGRHPEWKASQVREAMRAWARDLGPRGHDHETGHGLVMLPTP